MLPIHTLLKQKFERQTMTTIEMTDAELDAEIIKAAAKRDEAEGELEKLTEIKRHRTVTRMLDKVAEDACNAGLDRILNDIEAIPDADEQLDLSRPERFDHESNMIG